MTDLRILVIDDDRALQRALSIGLRARGYDVVAASNGTEGVVQASLAQPDLVVLDMSLPDLDGVDVCSRIREFSDVPIIVLSALGSEARKVEALDHGADDYVTKPFGMAELEARLRVLLRRSGTATATEPTEITIGPLVVDLVHHMASLDGEPLHLTAKEFDLLAFLAHHPGKVCTHQMILREVWGGTYSTEAHYLRVYAHRVRKKLGRHGAMLVTHPGIGYELCDDEPRQSASSS
jgi:two-component system KDP operon response regulator KdpE